jgi:diguanylate cyclase (GGDEF)-like protein/PAS domain S-box-containing protein
MGSEQFSYETLLDHLQDGVYLVDASHRITYWNRGAERLLGHARAEVLGRVCGPDFLAHADANGRPFLNGRSPVQVCLVAGEPIEGEVFVRHQSGEAVPVHTRVSPILAPGGEIIGAMEVISPNSAQLQTKQRIRELEELALLCPLTEVGNRRYADIALQNAVEELRRFGWPFGLLFVDVDHFKQVNDTHGHAIGDEVLRMVAHGLRSCLRSFDFVGRWGGEEFVVILPNITDEIMEAVAQRCRRLIEDSEFQSGGRPIRVTVSIGGTMARPEETPQDCVDRADRCMYRSKQEGRNRVTLDA